jgi:alkylation response protein AidB-like acyl-CoA dehydrogenase
MATQVRARDPFELQAVTDPGRRLVELAEAHAADFATRADRHDREASFPFENLAALQRSGVMAACVPQELGGLGVIALHDVALGINRLARGDAATALAVNMHSNVPWLLAPQWRAAREAGDAQAAAPLEGLLRGIGAGQVVIAAAFSEPGTDMLHPRLDGARVAGGWSLRGRKAFATASPAAHLLFVPFRTPGPSGEARTLATLVPTDAPGLQVLETWDALGMRASASHELVFHDCFVPEEGMTDLGPWGEWSRPWLVGIVSNHLGLVATFLGIAEAARDHALELVTTRRRGPSGRLLAERPGVRHLVAENEIDLAACRAVLARAALLADACFQAPADPGEPLDALHALHKELQCAKWLVTRTAIDVVDRAMTLSGGAGYLSRSPLARLYRDVRAGPLMQPFSPNEVFEYVGKVATGLAPEHDD